MEALPLGQFGCEVDWLWRGPPEKGFREKRATRETLGAAEPPSLSHPATATDVGAPADARAPRSASSVTPAARLSGPSGPLLGGCCRL